MDEDSDVTVLMEDDLPLLDTFSSTHEETKDKKVVLVGGGGNWITGAIQDTTFPCINAFALKYIVESDNTKAVGNWMLKVDLEDLLSAECMNKMMVSAKDTVTATVCIVPLKEGVVDQIMNAIDFEELKA